MKRPEIEFKITTLQPALSLVDKEKEIGSYTGTIYNTISYLESIGIGQNLNDLYRLRHNSKIILLKPEFFNYLEIDKEYQQTASQIFANSFDFHVKIERLICYNKNSAVLMN